MEELIQFRDIGHKVLMRKGLSHAPSDPHYTHLRSREDFQNSSRYLEVQCQAFWNKIDLDRKTR